MWVRRARLSVAQVAAEVGYESEAAFNRAFKREFTVPPARFRSQSRSEEVLVQRGGSGKNKFCHRSHYGVRMNQFGVPKILQ